MNSATDTDTTESTALAVPEAIIQDAQAGMAEALSYVEIATDFQVTDQESAAIAAEQLSGLARFRKGYDQRRLENKRPYTDLTKAIDAEYNPALDKAGEAEKLLRAALLKWQTAENDRIAREKREAQEADDRRRREAQAELDKANERAERVTSAPAQERATERVAEAQRAVDVANVTVSQAAMAKTPQLKGFSVRDNWVPVLKPNGLAELVKAAAADPRYLRYLALDDKTVKATVKAMKDATDIPGVIATNQQTTAVR